MFERLSPAGVAAAALIAPPEPDLITALAAVDPATLSASGQVDLLIGWERQASWIAAQTIPVLAAVGATAEAAAAAIGDPRASMDLPLRAAHAEIGAAIRSSDHFAATRLSDAQALTGPLCAVAGALAAGDISAFHAHVIAETTSPLTDAQQTWVAARVLPRARRQTVAQLRRSLTRAIAHVAPKSAGQRAKQAHAERRLDFWPLPDGMAELRLISSAADVMTLYGTADTLAHTLCAEQRRAGAPRTPIAALRADALVALITGDRSHAGRNVELHVTLDLPTLLGLREHPGELAGYGPLPAPLTRILATDAKWRRLIHDPFTGHLLDLGHTAYEPSAALARWVQTRNRTCIVPTCNRNAQHGDIDHTRPYQPDHPEGGRTDRDNLRPACGNHHKLKHHAGFTLRTDPDDHTSWTSPAGHSYTTQAHDYRSLDTSDLPPDQPPPDWPIPDDPDQFIDADLVYA